LLGAVRRGVRQRLERHVLFDQVLGDAHEVLPGTSPRSRGGRSDFPPFPISACTITRRDRPPHDQPGEIGSSGLRKKSVRAGYAGRAVSGATMVLDEEIEVLRPDLPRGRFRSVLFDFDGTLSLIREGWPRVMIPMMVDELRQTPTAESDEQLTAA